MVEKPVVPVMISQLVSKFKELVKKVTYDKSEIDSKLNGKASNTLVSSSNNGLMSSVDKIKLDGVEEEANKIIVDSAISDSSVNPVQNKIVHQELANKSDINHTHSVVDVTDLSVASSSSNGLMSSTDKVKLDGIDEEADKTVVDSAMSSTSMNPVQNKVVKAELDSLNNNKANTSHTHNDNSGVIKVDCSYGDVYKFKKNGWAVVVWQNLDLTSIAKNTWVTIATIGWSNQLGSNLNYHGNFNTLDGVNERFIISPAGNLRVTKTSDTRNTGHYGYIIYPTED